MGAACITSARIRRKQTKSSTDFPHGGDRTFPVSHRKGQSCQPFLPTLPHQTGRFGEGSLTYWV
ncbi:hypothetical protein ART_2341 [Arthrobacter sp. PAMC 25486]|nr:hypothetical protein ART_2341 [Arthrobacter sp. PAMC 25486]